MRNLTLMLALILSFRSFGDVLHCPLEQRKINQQIEREVKLSSQSHIQKWFRNGGSYLLSETRYKEFVKGKTRLGRPDGKHTYLFVAGGVYVDHVLHEAWMGRAYSYGKIEKELGLAKDSFPRNKPLIRIDVDVARNCARLPRAVDPGANPFFKPGGFTSGGIPEILVIDAGPKNVRQIATSGAQ